MVPLIGTEDPLIAMDLRGRVPFVSPPKLAAWATSPSTRHHSPFAGRTYGHAFHGTCRVDSSITTHERCLLFDRVAKIERGPLCQRLLRRSSSKPSLLIKC
jgi:hypothetical protein